MSSPAATDQFRQAFREEAREILVELEAALLELNEHRADMELVGRAFRALHTIKGSGAMFGFEALAAFTHNLENAFDDVRSGRLAVIPELVDLSLEAIDHIRDFLEDDPPDNSIARDALLTRLRAMTSGEDQPPAEKIGSHTDHPSESGSVRFWTIHFAPGPQLMRGGSDPLLLIRELGELGELAATANMASVPPLAELDPERCYISWDFILRTSASLDAIRDVFIFVEDCCSPLKRSRNLQKLKPSCP